MSSNLISGASDRLLHQLAAYTCNVSVALDPAVKHATKRAIMDAFGVAMGALEHPAAQIARRYAAQMPLTNGATLWGTYQQVTAEAATLANGVPLRGYDFNDLYVGKTGGHPSDMIPGLIALSESRGIDAASMLNAVALGYEVTINLLDAFELESFGWDYPNVVAIGATCAAARLLGLSARQTAEALAITFVAHLVSDEVESGDLNSRGDLTMWKRFNGSDAIRHSIYSCVLAEAGAEGAVRPFDGKSGFFSKISVEALDLQLLFSRLDPSRPLSRITEVTYKRWPVGSRAQSAIQATLEARKGIPDIWQVQRISVFSDDEVYDHLVRKRPDAWSPKSRETADHSLPYIVATAALDGSVDISSFDLSRVLDPSRQKFLTEKIHVTPISELGGESHREYLSRVEIVTKQGEVFIGDAKAPPGHPKNPLVDADFGAKFLENVVPILGKRAAENIVDIIWNFDKVGDVRFLTNHTRLQTGLTVESPSLFI